MVLCPSCRDAVPDRVYFGHQREKHNPWPPFGPAAFVSPRPTPFDRHSRGDAARMCLAGFDLSQVEARVELMLAAGTPEFYGTELGKEAVRLATAHPRDFDIHRYVASIALNKPESEITDVKGGDQPSERQIGKTTGHGWMRGMGAQTMSDSFLKKGFVVTPETCAIRLARLDSRLPMIRDGYFIDSRRQMMRFRGLATTFGGIWRCDWQKLEEDLYGSGYSYPPQRECIDLLNQCSYLPLRGEIKKRLAEITPPLWDRVPRINVHVHDALDISTHPDDVYPMFRYVDQTMGATTRTYYAGKLCVPVTYSLGPSWAPKFEWNNLPDEKTVRDAAWSCIEGDGAWGFVEEGVA
jgi:hypothetical protein